ncbi:MAG: hypothetical protein ABSE06_17600 [Anaerolineaceae bacterium]
MRYNRQDEQIHQPSLEQAGFHTLAVKYISMWGVPVEIVLA